MANKNNPTREIHKRGNMNIYIFVIIYVENPFPTSLASCKELK